MFRFLKYFKVDRDGTPAVTEAVAAWRATERPAERLSPAARARLLGAASRDRDAASGAAWRPPLFVPFRTLAWGGVLPALVLGVALGSAALRDPAKPAAGMSVQATVHASVQATKQGDVVVFRISNGGRPHTISRSQDPSGSWETLGTVRGEFRDRLDDSRLVFYRID